MGGKFKSGWDGSHDFTDKAGNVWTLDYEIGWGWDDDVTRYRVKKNGTDFYGPDSNIEGENDLESFKKAFENKTGEFGDQDVWMGNTMSEGGGYAGDQTDTGGFYEETAETTGTGYGSTLTEGFSGSDLLDVPLAGSPTLKDKSAFAQLVEDYRTTASPENKKKLMNIMGSLNPELTEDQINAKLMDISSAKLTGKQKGEAYGELESDVYGLKGDIAAGFGGASGTAATGMGTTARASRTAGVQAEKGVEDAYELYRTGLEETKDENVDSLVSSLIG
jgi:hypothetical protein